MISKGVIKEVYKINENNLNHILVKIYKESGCPHCTGCVEENKFTNEFDFTTNLNAEIGDTVTFEIETKKLFKVAFLTYIFPCILMIISYFIASLNFSENKSIIISFLFLIIGFIIVYFYDKISKNKNSDIKILKIEKGAL